MMDSLPLLLGSVPVSRQCPSPTGDPRGCHCHPNAGCWCRQELRKLFPSQLDNPNYYLDSRSGLLIKLGTTGFAVPAACLGRGIYLLPTREGN